jgi:hypothetical protein
MLSMRFLLLFYYSKSVFLAVNAGLADCFPLAEGLCKFYAKAEGNNYHSANYKIQYKQQANPLLSIHNYTTIVRNDKTKQLTINKPT